MKMALLVAATHQVLQGASFPTGPVIRFARRWTVSRFSHEPLPHHDHEDKLPDIEPVKVLALWDTFAIVEKPPTVPCHNSGYLGISRSVRKKMKAGELSPAELSELVPPPLLQRARETLGRKVNLVHRLDRGASGCVLVTFSRDADTKCNLLDTIPNFADEEEQVLPKGTTAALQAALSEGRKT